MSSLDRQVCGFGGASKPLFLLSDKSLPWLGPLWVAACLREQGHQVRVLDLAGCPDYVERAKQDARTIGADCYGLTATAPDYPLAVQIRDAIRSVNPQQRVILGGAHATTSPAHCHGWNAVVAGDGFIAAERALTEDGVISASRRGEIVSDVDALPFPARDLVDLESYDFRVCGERATSFMGQFGCSMGCAFCCGRELFVYRKVRAMSPQRVIAELDHVRSHWPLFRAAMFYDDEINVPPKRAIDLCEAWRRIRQSGRSRGFVKAELFSPEVARSMAKAGFVETLSGVESGSDRILKLIRKNTTYNINLRARRLAKEHGIRFKASVMVGLPTETYEDAMLTKRWLIEAAPDELDVTIYSPMVGSPIADHPDTLGKGLFFEDPRDGRVLPYKTAPFSYETKVRTETLSSAELVALRDEIERDAREALGLKTPQRPSLYDASMGMRPVLG